MTTFYKIKQELQNKAEEKFKNFSSALLPNVNNVLGIRIPELRLIAKRLVQENSWQEYLQETPEFMEETLIQGFIIGLAKIDNKTRFELIKSFIPKITNWGICDTFCSSLKFTKKNKPDVWEFLQKYANSEKEFEIRFALVMILGYFVEKEYLNEIFKILNVFSHEKYYAKMGAAWLISICFIKYPHETEEFLKTTKIDNETFNKAIQKISDSYRVEKSKKQYLKTLKRI